MAHAVVNSLLQWASETKLKNTNGHAAVLEWGDPLTLKDVKSIVLDEVSHIDVIAPAKYDRVISLDKNNEHFEGFDSNEIDSGTIGNFKSVVATNENSIVTTDDQSWIKLTNEIVDLLSAAKKQKESNPKPQEVKHVNTHDSAIPWFAIVMYVLLLILVTMVLIYCLTKVFDSEEFW